MTHEIDKSEEKTNSLQQLFILIVGFSSFIVCKFHIFMKEIEFNLDNLYDYRISASNVWRCLGDRAIVWLTKFFNLIFRSNKMPEE